MRLRNDPQAHEKLINSGVLIQQFPYKLTKDTIIELGMGKGEMLTELARLNPDKVYVGIEKYATVAAKAAIRAKNLGLTNFFIINEDIAKLPEILDGKINTIWLTFSDPWPKAKHERRRLTYKTFLDLYMQILDDNGVIRFKTDNDKLFEYSVEHMTEYGLKLSNVTRDFHAHEASQGNVMTGYETKWSSEGKTINYLEARKK